MKMTCIRRNFLSLVIAGLASLLPAASSAYTNVVEKVADCTFYNADGVGVGEYYPVDRFTQMGTNLWFTTQGGGISGAGTISRFDLVTHQIAVVASFDNNTGKASESSILAIGNEGYFTTLNGGTGDAGTIAKINFDTGVITTLYNFPTNNVYTRTNIPLIQIGSGPRAGLTRIGDELWTTTSAGGISNRGTVVKYNLTNGITTLVTNFDGPNLGGQVYGGFVKVGDAYYYNTYTGGGTFGTTSIYPYTLGDGSVLWTTNSLSLGGGTLSRMTFDTNGNPIFTRLIDLPGGFNQFPCGEPVLAGTNSIYFGTTGPNPTPGAIIRYDISTGFWTNVFLFATNSTQVNAYGIAYGARPGFNGLTEWQNELYFMNRLFGVSNAGVIAKFNIASNVVIKLADLTGTGTTNYGSAANGYNVGAVVEETNRFFMYFPVARGGAGNYGTVMRVSLPPPPIQAGLQPDTNGMELSWTGGYEPFNVQSRTNLLEGDWVDALTSLTNRSASFPMNGGQEFFRITGSE